MFAAACGGDPVSVGEDAGGGEEVDGGTTFTAPAILNPSFERTSLDVNCHANIGNESFGSVMEDVIAFGAASQIDIYGPTCFDMTPPDGSFHVGLGVWGGQSDAIAMRLESPLEVGRRYRIRFAAQKGNTAGIDDSYVRVGLSTSPTELGTVVHQTELLPAGSAVEIVFDVVADTPASFITFQAEVVGSLGWAFVDHVRLEPG